MRVDGPIYQQVFAMLAERSLPMPQISSVALAIVKEVSCNDASVRSVAAILGEDAVLAGRMMAVANSARYQTVAPASSLPEAVSRIGLNATRNLTLSLSLDHASAALPGRFHLLAERCNDDARGLAAAAGTLASMIGFDQPERAILAGLVCDIGRLPVIAALSRNEESPDLDTVMMTAEQLKHLMSGQVLAHWNLPADLLALPMGAQEWMREPRSRERLELMEVIIAARLEGGSLVSGLKPPEAIDTPLGQWLREYFGNEEKFLSAFSEGCAKRRCQLSA